MAKRLLYNNERVNIKEDFLKQYKMMGTRNMLEYVLSRPYELESKLDKDISEFNYNDAKELISSLKAKTLTSLVFQVNVLERYMRFAIESGYIGRETNPFEELNSEKLEKYLDKNIVDKGIITIEDLEDICYLCENSQDALLFALIFDVGVGGKDYEEIKNIKLDRDFNDNTSELTLRRNDGGTRIVKVNRLTSRLLKMANKESNYIKNNGNLTYGMLSNYITLVDNEYVLKGGKNNRKGRNIEDTKVIKTQTILHRIRKINSFYGNEHITPKTITYSGMIWYGRKLKEELGIRKLEVEHYMNILKRYGQNPKLSNAYFIRRKIDKFINE